MTGSKKRKLGHTYLLLFLELLHKLISPPLFLLPLPNFFLELNLPLLLNIFSHSPQRLAEVIFISLDYNFEFTDSLRLVRDHLGFLVLWSVDGERWSSRQGCFQ